MPIGGSGPSGIHPTHPAKYARVDGGPEFLKPISLQTPTPLGGVVRDEAGYGQVAGYL